MQKAPWGKEIIRSANSGRAEHDNLPDVSLWPVFAGEQRSLPDYEGSRTSDHFILHLIFSGEGCLKQDNEKYHLTEGTIYCSFPGIPQLYGTRQDRLLSSCWVGFNGREAEGLLNRLSLSPTSPVIRLPGHDDEETSRLRLLIVQIREELICKKEGFMFRATGNLWILFGELVDIFLSDSNVRTTKTDVAEQVFVAEILQFLETNYHQSVSIQLLARQFGVSKSKLCRTFKKHKGISINEYITRLRMNLAKHLLLESNLAVSEVAYSVGYADPAYFSRLFRKRTARTPTEFRSNLL